MSKQDFYDDLEIRDPAAREAANMAALPAQIANAKKNSAWYAGTLKDIDPASDLRKVF